jgi:hypothetical protein
MGYGIWDMGYGIWDMGYGKLGSEDRMDQPLRCETQRAALGVLAIWNESHRLGSFSLRASPSTRSRAPLSAFHTLNRSTMATAIVTIQPYEP